MTDTTTSNFTINQGETWAADLFVEDSDGNAFSLSGYTVASQLRRLPASSGYYNITSNVTYAASGQITLSLTANETSAINYGEYMYDVEITSSGGDVTRILQGTITITPEITR